MRSAQKDVAIDTRNGMVGGPVTRIDAAVVNGTVAVDVGFDEARSGRTRVPISKRRRNNRNRGIAKDIPLCRPAGERPSRSGTVGIFKITEHGTEAARVNVKLGRSSVNTIEVAQGLSVGDKVILSDMSAWDNFERIRLR